VRLLVKSSALVYLYSPLPVTDTLGGEARAFAPARTSCRAAMLPLVCKAIETEAGVILRDQWVLYLPPDAGIQAGDGVGNADGALFICEAVQKWPQCVQAVITRICDTEE
jgi:hypothetical protein